MAEIARHAEASGLEVVEILGHALCGRRCSRSTRTPTCKAALRRPQVLALFVGPVPVRGRGSRGRPSSASRSSSPRRAVAEERVEQQHRQARADAHRPAVPADGVVDDGQHHEAGDHQQRRAARSARIEASGGDRGHTHRIAAFAREHQSGFPEPHDGGRPTDPSSSTRCSPASPTPSTSSARDGDGAASPTRPRSRCSATTTRRAARPRRATRRSTRTARTGRRSPRQECPLLRPRVDRRDRARRARLVRAPRRRPSCRSATRRRRWRRRGRGAVVVFRDVSRAARGRGGRELAGADRRRPPTPSGGGSAATCTTARSSGSCGC